MEIHDDNIANENIKFEPSTLVEIESKIDIQVEIVPDIQVKTEKFNETEDILEYEILDKFAIKEEPLGEEFDSKEVRFDTEIIACDMKTEYLQEETCYGDNDEENHLEPEALEKVTEFSVLKIKRKWKKPRKQYICSVCKKEFRSKSHLVTHIVIHTNIRQYVCQICQKDFKQNAHLQQHIKIVHTGYKPFECEFCQKKFSEKSKLTVHKLLHKNERTFICEICHKTFNQKSGLIHHGYVHTTEKPFICGICGIGYKRKQNLQTHELTHKVKIWNCDICGKCFSRRAVLTEHQEIHLTEKSYACDLCPKKFKTKRSIQKHKNRHIKNALQETCGM